MKGVIIKVFRDGRGYGFLRGSDGRARFIHASDVGTAFDVLQVGMEVVFTPIEHPRGLRAKNVRPTDWEEYA